MDSVWRVCAMAMDYYIAQMGSESHTYQSASGIEAYLNKVKNFEIIIISQNTMKENSMNTTQRVRVHKFYSKEGEFLKEESYDEN
ncbi:hypothetical protein FGO68_gene8878 [Halteria grandinella]|uniref:Uncharacterized protein n=1 Tax=Halteria grandinella TaxID=5974 RepID=A0A8J8ND14_HALGN|nr:hypothetical protein FGO68_gene8878 [Halteria grandinella]